MVIFGRSSVLESEARGERERERERKEGLGDTQAEVIQAEVRQFFDSSLPVPGN